MPEAYKFEFLDVAIPEPGADEVVIQMKRIGICGSDIQIYHGKHKYMTFPVVQGHEGAGIVTKVGTNVKKFKIGDNVTVQPQIFCGKCFPCESGNFNVCENLKVYGVHADGFAAEYFAVDESKVLLLPEQMDFDQGALVEPVAVAVHAAKKGGDIKGANVVVMGAGPIGNLTAQAAKALGAGKVMITDINSKRLDLAKSHGIDFAVNTMEKPLKEAINEYFGSRKADVIIDCAAVKASITEAISSARPSSKVVIVGNFKEPVEIELPMLQRREVDLIGVMMYIREDFEDAIKFMSDGSIKTDGLISDYFNVKEFSKAYEYIDNNSRDVMKVMIKIDKGRNIK